METNSENDESRQLLSYKCTVFVMIFGRVFMGTIHYTGQQHTERNN